MSKLVKCEKCGREFEMTNPEYGCPYCNKEEHNRVSKSYDKNTIAVLLRIVGYVLFIIGIIGGIIFSNLGYKFNFAVMITIWICFGVSALMFFAFAEIIQILHDIRRKLNR